MADTENNKNSNSPALRFSGLMYNRKD